MIRILSLAVVAASLTLASCATAPKKCCAKDAAAKKACCDKAKAAGAKCDSCEKPKAGHSH